MIKISALILTKNEEPRIRECLENLSFCDEIILIDNGSTDKTIEIAESLSAKIVSSNVESFAQRRKQAMDVAGGQWLLYVDADERVDDELKHAIKKTVEENKSGSYFLQRKNFYLGNNLWPHTEKLLRFFKKENLTGWSGDLHETAQTTGESYVLEGYLLHFTHRDLESMVSKTRKWSDMEAITRFNTNHPKMSTWRFLRVMLTGFLASYILQGGYKAKTMGIIESMYQAFSMFITYSKLWEMQNADERKHAKKI